MNVAHVQREVAVVAAVVGAVFALARPAAGAAAAVGRNAENPWNKRRPLKETFPWYHSADEISSSLNELVGNCKSATIDIAQKSEVNNDSTENPIAQLDVLHISRQGGAESKTKAMMVFGEHAREIISPESALNFVQTLCGQGPAAERASHVLDNVSFTIVPNANPIARKKVEEGYWCKRTNEDGVDLNRNFGDSHRDASMEKAGDEQNPGPRGFSEPESRIIKSLVDEEKPDIYLSIHSGAYLLGTPFGYTESETPATEDKMLEVLRPVSDKYCKGQCPYGNLAKLIHYENPGCDIDYVAEQGTPYVFTWEIYVGETFRGRYVEEAQMQREGKSFLQTRERGSSSLRGTAALRNEATAPENEELVDSCLEQFNPQTQDETDAVIGTWTGAYLELCEGVAAEKRGDALAASKASDADSDKLTSLLSASPSSGTSSPSESVGEAPPSLDDEIKKLA